MSHFIDDPRQPVRKRPISAPEGTESTGPEAGAGSQEDARESRERDATVESLDGAAGAAHEPDPLSAGAGARALEGKRVGFLGKLGGVGRREAKRLVRAHGGIPVDADDRPLDLLVWGAEQLPLASDSTAEKECREAADRGEFELLTETQFWQRLGLVENESHVKRLYTPAMLAQLLNVPIAIVRRWHRRGLIVPEREVHRLPYFDFQEVATARRLAQLLAAGDTPSMIERKLATLNRRMPDVQRPLAQLSVIIHGRQLLLRQGHGLIEPGGQRRLDFDAGKWDDETPAVSRTVTSDAPADTSSSRDTSNAVPATVSGGSPSSIDRTPERRPPTVPFEQVLAKQADERPSAADLIEDARVLEDEGEIGGAIELYRAALLAGGPNAAVCFQLAELLYQAGETLAARERYAMAIELDEEYVEARANLGCVLIELGHKELAVAAFQGALASHADYPDVHYHLARLLDSLGRATEAEHHWQQFLELSPDSPWADEAAERLESS